MKKEHNIIQKKQAWKKHMQLDDETNIGTLTKK